MDWFYTNRYNETMSPYDNWWDFEIGAPMSLQDAYVMVFDRLTPTQVGNYARATAHFTPTPAYTGANLMWKARVVGVRSVMIKNYAELRDTRDCMSQLFPYVTTGDGFYTDGSFIQHDRHPYTGGYGMQVIGNAGPMLQWLQSSAGEVLDPAQTNFFNWVYDTYAPLAVPRGGDGHGARAGDFAPDDRPFRRALPGGLHFPRFPIRTAGGCRPDAGAGQILGLGGYDG